MNDEQLADLRRRFAEAGIPQLAQITILNQAREAARTERGVYLRALAGIKRHRFGVQQEFPWAKDMRRR